jgi:hypothetical protein
MHLVQESPTADVILHTNLHHGILPVNQQATGGIVLLSITSLGDIPKKMLDLRLISG